MCVVEHVCVVKHLPCVCYETPLLSDVSSRLTCPRLSNVSSSAFMICKHVRMDIRILHVFVRNNMFILAVPVLVLAMFPPVHL